MHHHILPAALTLILLATPCAGAEPQPPVPVRTGNHPGFGRLVFDFSSHVTWRLSRDHEKLAIRFTSSRPLASASSLPRNVLSFTPGDGIVAIILTQDATIRVHRLGDRVILDAFDPPTVTPPAPARPAPSPPAAHAEAGPTPPPDRKLETPTPAAPATPANAETTPTPAPDRKPDTPVPAAPQAPAPQLALQPVSTPSTPSASPSLLLPFEPGVGAAALPLHRTATIVFDVERPIDLTTLRPDSPFARATVRVIPGATILTLPLPAHTQPALTREPAGWRLSLLPEALPARPLAPQPANGQLRIPAGDVGQSISVVDPETGGILLVGTVRKAGQAIITRLTAPQFVVRPTWLGCAVEPLSDRLSLQRVPLGFVLRSDGVPLALTAPTPDTTALASAAGLTRRFRLPALPTAALAQRMRDELAAASLAPPLARGPLDRVAARSMIALGLGAEAHALLRLAALQDPREATLPDHDGLSAVAALIAHHPDQAAGIQNPALAGSDEITLWRAVREAELSPASTAPAPAFAATWPLILTYGPPLRQKLLPLAAENMIAAGSLTEAQALLNVEPTNPALTLARGMLAEAQGKSDAALSIYDNLANGTDRLARIRAVRRAVELRLARGIFNKKQAADALEHMLAAWHGGAIERNLRLRLADLRAESGAWRQALSQLRSLAQDFPDQRPEIRDRRKQTFAAFLKSPDLNTIPPLEFVALIDENTDVQPENNTALQGQLADKLLALDLPHQAAPVLEKLLQTATSPLARAQYGTRLAELHLAENNPTAAQQALTASANDSLPRQLTERRTLAAARAEDRTGNTAAAITTLAGLTTQAADELRADILERAHDWPAAERALSDYAAKTVPPSGDLNDAQRRTLLRLATAMTRAGDQPAVTDLRTREAPRMGTGPLADMFRLLTQDPIRRLADLPRSEHENALAHALPENLKALR